MFFWYLGAGTALLLVTLGPRRIDFRLALAGLVLPLVDIPLRLLLYRRPSPVGVHLYLHTFAFPVVLALGVMTFLRGARARTWFVVPMAVVIHLLLAGMLGDPVGAFWPLLGTHFSHLPAGHSLASQIVPSRTLDYVKEALGLGVLVYAAVAFGLHRPGPRRTFLRTGALPTRSAPAPGVRSAMSPGPSPGPKKGAALPTVEWPRSQPGDRGPGPDGTSNGHGAEEGPGSTGQDAG
jgi:hypothetical protein